ncbi:hypothetical protein CMO92_01975 [Candidatus Woesearchaeota archaeon]|nr:hypothetical protein [Candidatus Woesearchaeota archaeon]
MGRVDINGARIEEQDLEMMRGSLTILKHVFSLVRSTPLEDAMRNVKDMETKIAQRYSRKDGKDTIYIDVIAEEAISVGSEGSRGHIGFFHGIYDKSGTVITEERGKVGEIAIGAHTPVIISDPIDRSSYMKQVVEFYRDQKVGDRKLTVNDTIGEAFDFKVNAIGPHKAMREGPNSSVTLLKDNRIVYSLILNLFNGDIYIASPRGVYKGDIRKVTRPSDIDSEIRFNKDELREMLCYTTDQGKYESNRKGTHLRFFDLYKNAPSPTGPLRFTYLIKTEEDPPLPVGVIAHNGEKIQEALPNIAIAFFSNQMVGYKLYCDRGSQEFRAERLMTPSLQDSIYNGDIHTKGIKLAFLSNYTYPSEFRDTTAFCHIDNDFAFTVLEGMRHQEYCERILRPSS